MKHLHLLMGLIFTAMQTYAEDTDSVKNASQVKSYNLKLNTRLHTLGQFSYGGRIVSTNPTLDFTFNYDRKNWGLLIFKAIDLVDHQTDINFTLAVVNKTFHLGSRWSITPNAGFLLEQSHSLADHGSDVAFILITSYKISKALTADYSALFGNMVLDTGERDWVNRIRILYSKRHLDFTVIGWHNNKVFDTAEYFSFGASAFYSRVRLSNAASMSFGISGVLMPYSNDPENYPKRNGLNFTVALLLD